MIGTLIDTITHAAIGMVFFLPVLALTMALFWWCARKYFQIIRRGYRSLVTQAALLVVAFGGFMAGVMSPLILLDPRRSWAATSAVLVGGFLLGGVVAVVATELLALLLPRRNLRRSGPRSAGFLASPAFHVLEVTTRVIAGSTVAVALSAFFWWSVDQALHLLTAAGSLLAIPATLVYWRRRAQAPTIEQALADDLRAPILHLRPFSQDAGIFSWVRSTELSRFSTAPRTSSLRTVFPVSMQQYLGPEFSRRIGPVIALGNPVDYLPPEGAARRYLPDDGWQPYLLGAAESASAIVMEFGPSDNLTWELHEIKRQGWRRKLFVVTAPPPQPNRFVDRLFIKSYTSARRTPTARWSDAIDQLRNAGYLVEGFTVPGPGAVVGFDDQARPTPLADGLAEPVEFVGVIARELGLPMTGAPLDGRAIAVDADPDDATLLAAQPDRLSEIWALAKRDGWSDRPLKSELRPLSTAVLPTEQLVGSLRVTVTFTRTLILLVTDRYLHLSHDGTDERCRELLARFPRPFRAGPDRVRVPRTHITEPLGTDGDSLVIGIAGHAQVRLPLHTTWPRYSQLGDWLQDQRQGPPH